MTSKGTKQNGQALATSIAADVGRGALARANAEGQRGMQAVGAQLGRAADRLSYAVQAAGGVGAPLDQIDAAAEGVRAVARYLRDNDPAAVVAAGDRLVRKHPYRALTVAAGLGLLLGSLLRSNR